MQHLTCLSWKDPEDNSSATAPPPVWSVQKKMVYVWIIKVGKRWRWKWQRITETCVLLDAWLLLRIISEVTSEEEPSNTAWFTLPVKVPVNLIPLPVTTGKPGVVFLATFVAAVSGRGQFHPEPSPRAPSGTPEEPFMMDKWEQILSHSFSAKFYRRNYHNATTDSVKTLLKIHVS